MRMSASSSSRAWASADGRESACEEDVHDLVVAAGRREDAHERLPRRRRSRSASSASSRCAVSSGDSPAMSSRPAGISQSRWRIGCRYCWISSTRSLVVDRDDRRGARVIDVLAHDLVAAVAERVAAHVPHPALVDEVAVDDLRLDGLVAQRFERLRRAQESIAASAIVDVEQLAGTVTLERRADEPAEQRMRIGRARAQLGVRLRGDVVRVHVARQLDVLDEVAVGREPREEQARAGERVAVARC